MTINVINLISVFFKTSSPGWSAIVNLKCDPKKTSIESAKFEVKADDFSWVSEVEEVKFNRITLWNVFNHISFSAYRDWSV